MNKPYVKQYGKDEEGNTVLLNPITDGYYHKYPNSRERRQKQPKMTNNRGKTHINLVPTPWGIIRYKIVSQLIPSKPIYAENMSILIGGTNEIIGYTKAKTIYHYKD